MSEARDEEVLDREAEGLGPPEDERRTIASGAAVPASAGERSASAWGAGGVAAAPSTGTTSPDYRDDLDSRRWNAAPLRNPEVEKTDPRIAVAAILILAAVTLIVLVAGYATGFWQLPGDEAAARGLLSAAVAALELLA